MTNAKFYRNFVRAGLGALALSYVPLSHATYYDLQPPNGWHYGGQAAGTYNTANAGAGYTQVFDKEFRTAATYDPSGRKIPIPAKLPLVPDKEAIKRVAAGALFANPALRTIGALAGWLATAGLVYEIADGLWKKVDPDASPSDGFEYSRQGHSQWFPSAQQACKNWVSLVNGNGGYFTRGGTVNGTTCSFENSINQKDWYPDSAPIAKRSSSTCPVGWYVTSAGCVQTPPMQTVTKDKFIEFMQPDPPIEVEKLPNIIFPKSADWPVGLPKVEPTFVPTGNPVPNPKYDPNKPTSTANSPYLQPGLRLDPSPTASNPWQVDVQPVDRPADSPVAKPEPSSDVNPDGTPKPDPGDKPSEEQVSLCQKHPDILACQRVDTQVEDSEIPKAQKTVSYQAENIWGGGSCPADKYARVGGQEIKVVDWSRDCQFVTDYVKPVALALSALIVAYILAGALKS